MGQNISSQPKLSGEISVNRIRTVCQSNSRPEKLKHFEASLLANDLNTLGFDIPVKNKNGKLRKSGEICRDIKHAAFPDVEEVCMINATEKGDHMHAVETMVKMFNENYGANIQLYKDPRNKSRGKRTVDDLCDDLYLTAGKVQRSLTNQPQLIKQKLLQQISELKQARDGINSQFSVLMRNARLAKDNDSVNTDLQTIQSMQKVIDGELNYQVYNAGKQFEEMVKQFEPIAPGSEETISGLRPSNEFGMLQSSLNNYSKLRFIDSREAKDNRVAELVKIAQLSAPAVNKCQECITALGLKIDDMSTLRTPEVLAQLSDAAQRGIRNASTRAESMKIVNCYQRLVSNPESCTSASQFASQVEQSSLPEVSRPLLNKDNALAQVAAALMGAKQQRVQGAKYPEFRSVMGEVSSS